MKKQILIIEDESLVAMDLQMSILSWGYECPFIAYNGRESYLWIRKNSTDLIIADLFQNNGKNNIPYLKKIRKHSQAPMIIFSSVMDEKILEKALKLMPRCFLFKPWHNHELKINVDLVLKI
jgi:DNA-binding NarL/FixJ family response regulator